MVGIRQKAVLFLPLPPPGALALRGSKSVAEDLSSLTEVERVIPR
jgi:hypothetical protein